MLFERKDGKGKTYTIPCNGVLTEQGILLESGEAITSGKVVELAKELSKFWNTKNYRGFIEAYGLSMRKLDRDDDQLLAGTVIDERGTTVRWAIFDAADFLDDEESTG